MDAPAQPGPGQPEPAKPELLDEEGIQRRLALEDAYEEILLEVYALEQEWRLDDRIAYAVRHIR